MVLFWVMADTPFGTPFSRLPGVPSTAQGSPLARPAFTVAPPHAPQPQVPVPKELRLPSIEAPELRLPAIPKSPPLSRSSVSLKGVTLSSISQIMVDVTKEERGVGLLRRLSMDANHRVIVERELDSLFRSRNPIANDAYISIVGLRDEGKLGYAYDDLGVFPAFRDQHGREYFPASSFGEFYVRIPRGVTRNQYASAYTSKSVPITQMPQVKERLILQPLRIPFVPLRYVPNLTDVEGLSDVALQDQLSLIVQATVSYVLSELEATCHISISADFSGAYTSISSSRSNYNKALSDFVITICRNLRSKEVLDLSEYLQHVWAPKARDWAKYAKK